jgi:hypothetical protein
MTVNSLLHWPKLVAPRALGWLALALPAALGAFSLAAPARACPGFIPFVLPPTEPPRPFVPGANCDTTCHLPPNQVTSKPRNAFGTAWATACLSGCDGAGHCGGCVPSYWGENGCVVAGDADNDTFTNDEELRFVPPTNPSIAGDVNECLVGADNCVAQADCSEGGPARNNFVCDCGPGYEGDGRASGAGCVNVDECDEDSDGCDVSAVCNDLDGSYECTCPGGFGNVFPGDECPDTDLCDPNPCSPLSTCVFAEGEALCRVCPPDYAGDPDDCPACPAGYEGDGEGGAGCLDIDECAVGDGPCYPGVTCTNTEGGFGCGQCPRGYDGDALGADGCVSDECRACSPFSRCTPGAAQPCTCNRGFEPTEEPGGCADVDECSDGLARCSAGSHCVNIPGSFLCECDAGFRLVGGSGCQQTTCATWNETCGEGAACDDSSGTPTCVCVDGAPGVPPESGSGPRLSGLDLGGRGAGLGGWWSVLSGFLFFGLLLRSQGRARAAFTQWAGAAKRLVHSASLLFVIAGIFLSSGCGDDEPGPAAGGTGALPPDAGTTTAGSGGSGGSDPDPSGGSGGGSSGSGGGLSCSLGGSSGQVPSVATCVDSRDCSASQWCNPASNECVARETGEAISFRDISALLRQLNCTTCHLPGGPGAEATGGSGDPLILDDQENFHQSYASLVGASVSCAGGSLQRVCVDDPASSRLVTMVFDTGNAVVSQQSIAFTTWTDPGLQTILSWIARGAPRDPPCGNYVVDDNEQCDDGPTPRDRCPYSVNPTTCQLCTPQCVFAPATGPYCGDGVVDAPFETCDDGNQLREQVPPNGAPVCGRSCTFEGGIQTPGL